MIEIDGALGEGGGQVLRTAIALSAVTQQPVRIVRIRAGRPNPGLSPQHVTSIEAVAALCDATVDGLHAGAREIEFRPGALLGGSFRFDIGTAGSIPLVMLSCLLPATLSSGSVEMTVTGGTDVRWAPPIDHFMRVHAPIAERYGLGCSVELVSRGFYPEGGGEARMEVIPSGGLRGVRLMERGAVTRVEGVAYSQNLPEHVVSRMRHAAMKKLVSIGGVEIESDIREGHSTGAGIFLMADCGQTLIGQSALGQRGVRAETLGESCASDLLESASSAATVDSYMLDQTLPYMALAHGPSVVVAEEMTGHAETNIAVIERFVDRRFAVTKNDDGSVEVAID
jgi:RNA 3'-terminal phosphate cyclase (ATP)